MAQSSLKDKTKIRKLNSENYSAWKFKVQMLFMCDEQDDIYSPRVDKAERRDKQAQATINLRIDDSHIIHFRDETTTACMG